MTDVDETVPLATLAITPQTPGVTAGTGTVNSVPCAILSITPRAPVMWIYPIIDIVDINGVRVSQILFESLYAGRESGVQTLTLINNHPTEDLDVTLTAALGSVGSSLDTVESTLLSEDDLDYALTTETVTIPSLDDAPVYLKWHPPSTAKIGEKSWTLNATIPILLSGWSYINNFTVTNTSDETLNNINISITIPYVEGVMESDFDDIRFYDGIVGQDTASEYDCQLWSKTNSVSATYLLRIPSIPADEDVAVYVYAGNSGASAATVTPLYFLDDFSGASIGDKWSIDNNGVFSIDNNQLKLNAGAFGKYIRAKSDGSVYSFTGGVIEFTLKSNGGYNEGGVAFLMSDMDNGYFLFPTTYSRSEWHLTKRVGGVTTDLFRVDGFVANTTYHIKIEVVDGTITVYVDGTEIGSVTDTSHTTGAVAVMSWGNTTSWFDEFTINPVSEDVTVGDLSGWDDELGIYTIDLLGGILYQPQELPGYTPVVRYGCRVGGVLYE